MQNDDFIMSPKVDFAFKEIMRNEIVRKGFLSAVLGIKDTEIKSTVMLNTNLSKVHEDEKQGILDVRLTMNDNTEINIEMQVLSMNTWANRSVFYISKMISEQPNINKTYSNIRKCISISVLDFNYITQTDKFHTSYHLREDSNSFLYTDIIELHVVELKKLPEVSDGTAIYDWAKFIKSEKREDFKMLADKNIYLKEAYNQLEIISQDQQKRLEYTARQKALYDYNTLMSESYDKGVQDNTAKIIKRLKAKGFSEEEIAEITN